MRSGDALALIQRCIGEERVVITVHFAERMAERGMFWPDVLSVIEEPSSIRTEGYDDYGGARWFIRGTAPDGLDVELLCTLDPEPTATFVTIYWED